jgi:hypothetical protein
VAVQNAIEVNFVLLSSKQVLDKQCSVVVSTFALCMEDPETSCYDSGFSLLFFSLVRPVPSSGQGLLG